MAKIGMQRLAAVIATVTLALAWAVAIPEPSSAATSPSSSPTPGPMVGLTGHGLGAGVGMGQWGALGYALNGYSYTSILSHYYGGTTMATVPDQSIRVVLTANDGQATVVSANTAFSVDGHAFAAGAAATMQLDPSGGFTLTEGASCTATTWTPVATLSATQVTAVPSGSTIELCRTTGSTSYDGDIEATSYQGSARTVNVVSLEDYLQSVVPAESPPVWGTLGKAGAQGQPEGFQELEAQAVAARSYVMSDLGQYGFADICDTSECQNYPGIADEDPTTTLAVSDTSGQVLELAGGAVASTQYSASTGGYTAGGTFPAVADPGDSICVTGACNPDHDWSTQVPVSTVDAAYPSIGVLEAITVTQRNGLGAMGGRVEALTVQGTTGQVKLTGDAFADALGLDSNWFSVSSVGTSSQLVGDRVLDGSGDVLDAGAATYHGSLGGIKLATPLVGAAGTPDGGGYWLLGSGGEVSAFGDAKTYGSAPALGRSYVAIASTTDGKGYWLVTSGGGVYTFGDAAFDGSLGGTKLASPIVAIAPTPDGGGYWLVSASGVVYGFGDAHNLGSAASMHLPLPIVSIAATPDGGGYWLLESNGGVFSFGDATYSGSLPGSKISNGRAIGMVPTPDGGGYLIGTTAGSVYHFGDTASLGPPTKPTTFHAPAVGLIGVFAANV